MAEIIQTAAALGIHLPDGLADLKIEQTRTMGAYSTSMQIDKQANRPLEVEAILGRPLQAAQTAGVSTPCLSMLYNMARLP
jgi:2-dehydropantoate 2-reductase